MAKHFLVRLGESYIQVVTFSNLRNKSRAFSRNSFDMFFGDLETILWHHSTTSLQRFQILFCLRSLVRITRPVVQKIYSMPLSKEGKGSSLVKNKYDAGSCRLSETIIFSLFTKYVIFRPRDWKTPSVRIRCFEIGKKVNICRRNVLLTTLQSCLRFFSNWIESLSKFRTSKCAQHTLFIGYSYFGQKG